MSLPNPILSRDDIVTVQDTSYESAYLIWKTWGEDPIKAAVLRAILSCQSGSHYICLDQVVSVALGQNMVCFLHSFSLEVEEVHY